MRIADQEVDMDRYEAVVFDLDGTLYDHKFLFERMILVQIGHLHYLLGERLAKRQYKGVHFESKEALIVAFYEKMAKGLPFSAEEAQRWHEEGFMADMLVQLRKHYRLSDWVKPTLANLRAAGKKVAIYSDYGHVEDKLSIFGLTPDVADLVVSAVDLGGLKPCKESMEEVLRRLGVSADRTLVVGDRYDTDGVSAEAVGADYLPIGRKGGKF